MDPTTGRWMQVDPKAEAAGSMSPYSSMGNNPISQVDPNGDLPFLAVAAIGAFTSVISNGINNHKSGQDFFAGAGEAALWGAASATVSGQVGAAFGNIGSVTNEIFRALAHGVTQGGLSAIQGNGFMNGALSGAVSSGVGSGIGALGGGPRELILGSGLSGGVANLLNRGSFSQGLLTGIFIGAFNHSAHMILQEKAGVQSGDQPPAIGDKKFIEGQGGSIVLLTYTADGWRVIGVIPGSGAVVPTDSPIEWILGAWKAPIQAVDNVGVLGFAKIMGGNISPIISGFSKHGLNQAISRGFKTADILKIVRNGNRVSAMGRYGSQVRYTLGQNTVVLNAKNQVVTVFSTAKNGMFVR
jgi:hypothetical protein